MQKTEQLLKKYEEETFKQDLEKKAEPKHERLCQYWAGCNPFTGAEGYCDCGSKLLKTEKKKNTTRQTVCGRLIIGIMVAILLILTIGIFTVMLLPLLFFIYLIFRYFYESSGKKRKRKLTEREIFWKMYRGEKIEKKKKR